MTYDSVNSVYLLSLINRILTEGKLKESKLNSETTGTKNFSYRVLNKNAQLILQEFIPNPLEITIEYVDDFGNLRKKDITLDSTQFSLRIPLAPDARYISLEMKGNRLLLIDLNEE